MFWDEVALRPPRSLRSGLVPTLVLIGMSPLPHSDRGDGLCFGNELLPGVACCLDDFVAGFEDAFGEPVGTKVRHQLPDDARQPVQGCFDSEAELMTHIEAANTEDGIAAVDLNTGWP